MRAPPRRRRGAKPSSRRRSTNSRRKGFAAARLEDVAKRAGVAKGTIYLYFADKETLFQELIRAKMVPVVGSIEPALATGLPLRAIVEQAIEIFVREVYGTRRSR